MTWVSETFLKKVNQQKHWPIIIGIVVSGFLLVAMTAVLIWFLVTVLSPSRQNRQEKG